MSEADKEGVRKIIVGTGGDKGAATGVGTDEPPDTGPSGDDTGASEEFLADLKDKKDKLMALEGAAASRQLTDREQAELNRLKDSIRFKERQLGAGKKEPAKEEVGQGHQNIIEEPLGPQKKTPSANRFSELVNPDGTPNNKFGITHAEVLGKPRGTALTDEEWAAAEHSLSGKPGAYKAPDRDPRLIDSKTGLQTNKTVADITDPVERARQTGDMSDLGSNVPATTSNPVASLVGSNQNQPVTSDQPVTGTPASATPSTVTDHAAAYRELVGAADLARNQVKHGRATTMDVLRATNAANDYKKQYGSKFTP